MHTFRFSFGFFAYHEFFAAGENGVRLRSMI